jgi:hypothetical protein
MQKLALLLCTQQSEQLPANVRTYTANGVVCVHKPVIARACAAVSIILCIRCRQVFTQGHSSPVGARVRSTGIQVCTCANSVSFFVHLNVRQ